MSCASLADESYRPIRIGINSVEDESKEILPASTEKEIILDVAAVVSGIAPWVGGPVSAVLSGMSISRKMGRIKEVILNMADKIQGLESEVSKDYVKTEEFQELLEKTLKQVADERNDEKRKAYAAFLAGDIKSPMESYYEEKIRFLRTLEDMQINHIQILKAMMQEPDPNPAMIGSVSKTLEKRLPNIPLERVSDLAQQLTDMRVADLTNMNTQMTGRGAEELKHHITPYGHRLIKYILSDE